MAVKLLQQRRRARWRARRHPRRHVSLPVTIDSLDAAARQRTPAPDCLLAPTVLTDWRIAVVLRQEARHRLPSIAQEGHGRRIDFLPFPHLVLFVLVGDVALPLALLRRGLALSVELLSESVDVLLRVLGLLVLRARAAPQHLRWHGRKLWARLSLAGSGRLLGRIIDKPKAYEHLVIPLDVLQALPLVL